MSMQDVTSDVVIISTAQGSEHGEHVVCNSPQRGLLRLWLAKLRCVARPLLALLLALYRAHSQQHSTMICTALLHRCRLDALNIRCRWLHTRYGSGEVS